MSLLCRCNCFNRYCIYPNRANVLWIEVHCSRLEVALTSGRICQPLNDVACFFAIVTNCGFRVELFDVAGLQF